jgi:hypothetical protein
VNLARTDPDLGRAELTATRLRGTYELSPRRKIAVLLREAADRFDERSLTGTAAMLRRSAMEIDEAEWEIGIGYMDDANTLLGGLEEFREHLGGRLTIMLLNAIGVPFDAHEINKGVMLGAIEVLRSIQEQA